MHSGHKCEKYFGSSMRVCHLFGGIFFINCAHIDRGWLLPNSSTIGIGYGGAEMISAESRNSICDPLSLHSYPNFLTNGE